jgi:glycerate 2-kinase
MARPYSDGIPSGPGGARRRADALACWRAAVAAVEPGRLVAGVLGREGDVLVLRDGAGRIRARHAGPVLLVGAGKAALAMARAAGAAARGLLCGGVLVVPHAAVAPAADNVAVLGGGHPLPDDAGAAASARLLAAVETAGPDVLVLALLSGGASALLEVPAPGVALEDLRALTAALLAAGVDIEALNTVRRHCSRVKGGGLARAAAGAAGLWALVLSDVVGDDPAVIASGPTVGDPTTFAEALAVLAPLPPPAVPAAIRTHLERGAAGLVAETVKPGDPVLARTATVVVGGNRRAVDAAAAEARARGYAVHVLAQPLTGDAAENGRHLAATILALPPSGGAALIGGGETTVRAVAGGRGGRCQHLALAAAVVLAGSDAVLLAAGTDGVDGPTDAAGACVDGGTVARARACGYDPQAALAATDSFPVLAATGDLVRSGPTGTNVADIVVALR